MASEKIETIHKLYQRLLIVRNDLHGSVLDLKTSLDYVENNSVRTSVTMLLNRCEEHLKDFDALTFDLFDLTFDVLKEEEE